LDLEEIIKEPTEQNAENKAAALASKMQLDYQKEILNRSQVFVSYSRKDKVWLTKLQAYLKSLERFTGIKTWDDTLISGGDQWMKEIEKALVTTKVAILLATADFFASDFIQNKEMAYLLEISNKENVKILWVAISSYPYEITPLNAIQCANDPSKPLDTLSEADQNKEMANICKTIVSFMK
jgi:hypothetical protein